ncbi:MAG: hypothetical protein ABIT20_24875 [Gemmatimonadaceae bacterium]
MKLEPVDALGRIVVVAAGFALWTGGRCIAAARWADIRRIQAKRPANATDTIRLYVELADGTLLEFHERAPGFDAFLDRASATLPGLLAFAAWHPALMLAPPSADGAVIFERPALRR